MDTADGRLQELQNLWKRRPIITSILVVVIAFTFGSMLWGEATEPETATKTSNTVASGEEGHLSGDIFVAATEEAYDELTAAIGRNDDYGMTELIARGSVFFVTGGTRILVMDSSFASRRIRVLEGDQVGKSGWVPVEVVAR